MIPCLSRAYLTQILSIGFLILTVGACSYHSPGQYTKLDVDLKKKNMQVVKKMILPHHLTPYSNYSFFPVYSYSDLYGYKDGASPLHYTHPMVYSTGYQDPRWQPTSSSTPHNTPSRYTVGELIELVNAIKTLGVAKNEQPHLQSSKSPCQRDYSSYDDCSNDSGQSLLKLLEAYTFTNQFDSNSSVVKPMRLPTIRKLANYIASNEGLRLEIRGHTDSTASDNHNHQLSMLRAKSIADKLLANGVSRSQISLFGFGRTKPLCSNQNETGKSINRRTELFIEGISSDYFVSQCTHALTEQNSAH